MIEIEKGLFIGNQDDYELTVKHKSEWVIIHACKEPYHRQLLGYTGKGAPKNHPEYLIARRENRLFLNLVDAADPAYIPKEIIDAALVYIHDAQGAGQQCLVHCNQGESRSPSIGLLYLVRQKKLPINNMSAAEMEFIKLYPNYAPKRGIREFIKNNWGHYANGE